MIGLMSKSLFGAVQHSLNEQISGLMRGQCYGNRGVTMASIYSYDKHFITSGFPDSRKFYSQTRDTGLRY